MRLSILLIFLGLMSASAQQEQLPLPKLGWASLSSRVQYPATMSRAGIRSALLVSIVIDSTGHLQHISAQPLSNSDNQSRLSRADTVFLREVSAACRNCEWVAGKRNGVDISMRIDVPFIFILHEFDQPEYQGRIIVKDVRGGKIETNLLH